jgi:uracil phosphoribosyltransferase
MKQHFLSILRDASTNPSEFRAAAFSLSKLLAAEAAELLPSRAEQITTPVGVARGAYLAERVVLAAILRSALAMIPAFLELFSSAPIGFLGIKRDESTALARCYYQNIPDISPRDTVILLDPMIATGGSALLGLQTLKERGASMEHTLLVSILRTKQGSEAIAKHYPAVRQLSAAVDPELNAQQFIVPGLGDFGDRFFDTPPLVQKG